METPESIRTSLIPGEWVSSIDLSDTYLHIPIHPNSRKYLRFCYKSQVFQFTSLPFGLATAPQVFTMIVKEVKLMALSRGLRILQYLEISRSLLLPDHRNSPRLARDALVLGSSAALNRDPTTTPSVNNPTQTVPQVCVPQQPPAPEPPRLVSRSGQLQEQGFSVEVA